jgi:hypothetical protein
MVLVFQTFGRKHGNSEREMMFLIQIISIGWRKVGVGEFLLLNTE